MQKGANAAAAAAARLPAAAARVFFLPGLGPNACQKIDCWFFSIFLLAYYLFVCRCNGVVLRVVMEWATLSSNTFIIIITVVIASCCGGGLAMVCLFVAASLSLVILGAVVVVLDYCCGNVVYRQLLASVFLLLGVTHSLRNYCFMFSGAERTSSANSRNLSCQSNTRLSSTQLFEEMQTA